MTVSRSDALVLTSLVHFLQKQLLWFLLGSYVLAAFFPSFGLWMRNLAVRDIDLLREETTVTLPMLMLAILLFNAGLGVKISELRNLLRRPLALIAGLTANLAIPILFIFAVNQGMRFWHNSDEVQNILVGLALIASMPIAGSSTAWSQNVNGNLALSLGLVLFSTFLSPVTTPVVLNAVGLMATGEYANHLHSLAAYGTGTFLLVCVLAPSLLGIGVSWVVGNVRIATVQPRLKLLNFVNLILISYSNASVSLPQAVAKPDWDFLAITIGVVVSLCILTFASGWLIARLLKSDRAQQVSLMFGLGMNNNGTGLVLASMALSEYPRVLLPIIFYNLVQQLAAGLVLSMARIK